MRISLLLFLCILITKNCLANNKTNQPDTSLMQWIDSIYLQFLKNTSDKTKYCRNEYENNADIDVFDMSLKSVSTNADRPFVIKLIEYSNIFCSDAVQHNDSSINIIRILKEENFLLEFYYHEAANLITDVLCIIRGSNRQILLLNGFTDND